MTEECNLPEGFKKHAAIKIELNPESIAKKLEFISIKEVDYLEQMSSNGYNLVKNKFTWNKIALSMEQTYEWLLKQTNKPEFIKLE